METLPLVPAKRQKMCHDWRNVKIKELRSDKFAPYVKSKDFILKSEDYPGDIVVTKAMERAYNLLVSQDPDLSSGIVLTGPPGCGKTTTLLWLYSQLEKPNSLFTPLLCSCQGVCQPKPESNLPICLFVDLAESDDHCITGDDIWRIFSFTYAKCVIAISSEFLLQQNTAVRTVHRLLDCCLNVKCEPFTAEESKKYVDQFRTQSQVARDICGDISEKCCRVPRMMYLCLTRLRMDISQARVEGDEVSKPNLLSKMNFVISTHISSILTDVLTRIFDNPQSGLVREAMVLCSWALGIPITLFYFRYPDKEYPLDEATVKQSLLFLSNIYFLNAQNVVQCYLLTNALNLPTLCEIWVKCLGSSLIKSSKVLISVPLTNAVFGGFFESCVGWILFHDCYVVYGPVFEDGNTKNLLPNQLKEGKVNLSPSMMPRLGKNEQVTQRDVLYAFSPGMKSADYAAVITFEGVSTYLVVQATIQQDNKAIKIANFLKHIPEPPTSFSIEQTLLLLVNPNWRERKCYDKLESSLSSASHARNTDEFSLAN